MSTTPPTTAVIQDTAADASIGIGHAAPIIEILDHTAARAELADVFDALGLASCRIFNRGISAAHPSSAIEELIELAVWPGPSRYRSEVDFSGCGLSPGCRHWRGYFLFAGSP
jgi:hypothetical protein